ncbi:restriction endonuclease [Streptomyces sp. ISL-36]|uniref:restriction endonuclease n=1 Tax=Streptomyces sp. ISL-36 TaxID=2819182 RepID=UPI002034F455|nr:restriction endonuclease [Streptomyces sp. ISL-36]
MFLNRVPLTHRSRHSGSAPTNAARPDEGRPKVRQGLQVSADGQRCTARTVPARRDIIQAKRTKNAVPAEAVRALAGAMHDKAAAKGILVTTGWFGKTSRDFAYRTGRVEVIDGRGLKALLLEHLGIDALIGLPKLPPGWEARDLT